MNRCHHGSLAKIMSLTLTAILAATGTIAAAQDTPADLDRYMTSYALDCKDVSFNCFDLVPRFFYENKPDSVFAMLDYWEKMCGPAEALTRSRILALIWNDSFDETIYDDTVLEDLIRFHWDPEGEDFPSWNAAPTYPPTLVEYTPGYPDYNTFTADLADQLLPHTDSRSLEELFCQFYAGDVDSLFVRLRRPAYRDTDLRRYYDQDLARLRDMADIEVAAYAGLWKPRDGLRALESHPTVGGLLGYRKHRFLARFLAEYRFLGVDREYIIHDGGEFPSTTHYTSFYIGLESGVSLLRTRHHGVDVFAGLGYDALQPFADEKTTRGALNTSIGAGYRLYWGLGVNRFVGLDWRLDKVGYETNAYNDLSGTAWSLRLSFGLGGDDYRDRRLWCYGFDRWE